MEPLNCKTYGTASWVKENQSMMFSLTLWKLHDLGTPFRLGFHFCLKIARRWKDTESSRSVTQFPSILLCFYEKQCNYFSSRMLLIGLRTFKQSTFFAAMENSQFTQLCSSTVSCEDCKTAWQPRHHFLECCEKVLHHLTELLPRPHRSKVTFFFLDLLLLLSLLL